MTPSDHKLLESGNLSSQKKSCQISNSPNKHPGHLWFQNNLNRDNPACYCFISFPKETYTKLITWEGGQCIFLFLISSLTPSISISPHPSIAQFSRPHSCVSLEQAPLPITPVISGRLQRSPIQLPHFLF